MKCRLAFIFIFLLFGSLLEAQVSSTTVSDKPQGSRYTFLSVSASPFLSIPVGTDASFLGLGGGSGLNVEMRLPFLPFAYTGAQVDYGYTSTPDPATSLSTVGLSAIAGVNIQLMPILGMKVFGTGGWFFGFLNSGGGAPENHPYFSGGVRLDFDLSDTWGIGAEGSYRYYAGLMNDVAVRLVGTYRIPAFGTTYSGGSLPPGYTPIQNGGRGLSIIGIKATPIFPVFLKYYDSHPFAELAVRNFESIAAESIKITAVIKDYMDNARSCVIPIRIEPGSGATAQVFALFNDKLLNIAEATKLTLTLILEYTQYEKSYRDEYAPSVDALFRNAMTWEDDRRMAAFISGRDPSSFGFTRGVLSATRAAFNPALSHDLQSAMLIYESLRSYGLSYVKDPNSQLASNNKTSVDSLQFPQQTMQYKTGDCDDLSILYCSLLESIGIETAFITTPGHVFAAFSSGAKPEDAIRYLGKMNDFIVKGDMAWIPVEMTALSSDFMGAWREGSREWLSARDKAALYPTHDAWTSYPPVVVSNSAATPVIPSASRLTSFLKDEVQALMNRELTPREAALIGESKKQGSEEKSLNTLGVLYARFGLYDKAEAQFNALANSKNYTPALINLGNLYLLKLQYKQAIAQFQKVLKNVPTNPTGLLGVAIASDRLGDADGAKSAYDKLKKADPALADRYAFLGSAGTDAAARAGSSESMEGKVSWDE
jgi:tetratricopeptide (TPR) repeat protein